MGVTDRPYIGTWKLNQKVVQHSPDCLVYFNGDLALPGCPKCNGRIDFQKYITSVTVECGVESGGASANISLSIPLHVSDTIVRDGRFLIDVGLEVHIYMRGYFPIKGQFKDIMPEESGGLDVTELATYPYYHVFHGVITNVSVSFDGGFQTATVQCNSMLHFWQFQNMSTNASYFGARPTNSKTKMSMVGHNFTGMHPYGLIYTLFHDVAGSAGGVGFALSSKSNQRSKSTLSDESLFSVNIRYWQERFSTRMINLRMYGASGQLFSTAQATFLARLSKGGTKDLLRGVFPSKNSTNSNGQDIVSAARTLGLVREIEDPVTGEITVQGPDILFAERGRPPSSATEESKGRFDLNVGSMQAYVSDISQWGNVNLFESTYETKLEVATNVAKITGFEFYQDADGDFVFKPPLYNLDTKDSRIYRIEPADIISFSMTHGEPEATYVTMKSSQFKNLKETGLENEWGVKGQYLDYKLIAQFGWRPHSFETAYLSSSKALFFSAVNRLDILNAKVRQASCSIPIRPELRPGFPVYVEHVDSYFYLQSLSHTFGFGSRCTTTLTLIGQRSKFFAPGSFRVDGIEAIDLQKTNLPERPLETIDRDGNPRTEGFPNVVMALNPNAINPLFFLVGSDLDDLTNHQVVLNLIELAKQYNILSVGENGKIDKGPYKIDLNNAAMMNFDLLGQSQIDDPNSILDNPDKYTFRTGTKPQSISSFDSFVEITQKYDDFQDAQKSIAKSDDNIRHVNDEIAGVQNELGRLQAQEKVLQSLEGNHENEIAANKEQQKVLTARIKNASKRKEDFEKERSGEQKRIELDQQDLNDIYMIKGLIDLIRDIYLAKNEDFDDPSSTSALLDLLSDKKAVFTNGQVPGFYQYYSSSHPNPQFQGQGRVISRKGEGAQNLRGTGLAEKLPSPVVDKGFVAVPTRPGPDGTLPEAELGDIEVVNGIRVLTSTTPAVLPTSRIQTLSFAKHEALAERKQTGYAYSESYLGLPFTYKQKIRRDFAEIADEISNYGLSIKALFETVWLEQPLSAEAEANLRDKENATSVRPEFIDGFEYTVNNTPFPESIFQAGQVFDTDTTSIYEFRDGILGSQSSPVTAINILTGILADDLIEKANFAFSDKWNIVLEINRDADPVERENRAVDFCILLGATTNQVNPVLKQQEKRTNKIEETFYSPVFPVSDENGYEVIGSYRYGRGLKIDGEGSFREVSLADPLQFASKEDVETFISRVQNKEDKTSDYLTEDQQNILTAYENRNLTPAEVALIDAINKDPGTPEDVKEFLLSEDLAKIGLSNWVASNKDFSHKLSINNAAFWLSDLGVHAGVDRNVCACRATQADVLVEAFSTENFVTVLPKNLDEVTSFSTAEMIARSQQWQLNRDAISGATVDVETAKLLANVNTDD